MACRNRLLTRHHHEQRAVLIVRRRWHAPGLMADGRRITTKHTKHAKREDEIEIISGDQNHRVVRAAVEVYPAMGCR
jgi:hypothetical protein